MSRKRTSKTLTFFELAGNFTLLLAKVFKSLLFNLLMFILGFGSAYMFLMASTHLTAANSENSKFIEQIEEDLQQQRILCHKIEKQLRIFKAKSIGETPQKQKNQLASTNCPPQSLQK